MNPAAFPPGTKPRLEAWAEARVPQLEDVASRYGDCISYGEIAEYLFDQTQVRTDQRPE